VSRARWLLAVLTLGACYSPTLEPACAVHCDFAAGGPCPDDFECLAGGVCAPHGMVCSAAPPDATLVATDGRFCYGQPGGLFRECFNSPPTGTLMTASGSTLQIDTDACGAGVVVAQLATSASPVCMMALATIEFEGTTTAVGSRPLVLLAADTMTVGAAGELDASGHGAVHGAGAGAACALGAPPGATGTAASGGGAGGSFQSAGGPGGGDINLSEGGGSAGPTSEPTFVRGGCDGTPGYTRVFNTLDQNPNGAGGGAVYVIAGTAINVTGHIDASGGGAPIAANHTDCKDAIGGRGGGTGGLIGLDAPTIQLDAAAQISAIGGGGSSGCNGGGQLSVAGVDGTAGGSGGPLNGPNGVGGNGSTNTIAGGAGGGGEDDGGGAGGGGGGTGFIWWASNSPPPSSGVMPQVTKPQ
jgi:hypothetical protein